ncbi:hypothetical protein BLOT_006327, partial [Blomia tropicalis]
FLSKRLIETIYKTNKTFANSFCFSVLPILSTNNVKLFLLDNNSNLIVSPNLERFVPIVPTVENGHTLKGAVKRNGTVRHHPLIALNALIAISILLVRSIEQLIFQYTHLSLVSSMMTELGHHLVYVWESSFFSLHLT